ncbi:MAG: SPOR domain-containing protein [Hyphomicrobiaceae bacterium]|nr:SPOR domain-containing protein [Hyphomicrobiaceae bacterium]
MLQIALVAWPLVAAPTAAFAAEQSAMVIDANTGKVLYSSAADERRYPASLTKMMTLYLTFDLIEKKRLSYSSRIKISAQAASQPPSKLELEPGETISVRDAIGALVTKSANDIAVALAEHIAGSEENFARLMTHKAHEIGMSKTTFRNASGLPNSDQYTTARDMLTLALRLQDDFPEHYKAFATRSFSYNGSSYRNHNTLLYHYRGTEGIKTGYTRASGFNLVAAVRRGDKHLVAAVFGGPTAGQRNSRMRAILDRAFAKASSKRTRKSAPQLIATPRLLKRPAPPSRLALAPTKPPPLPATAPEAASGTTPGAAAATSQTAEPSATDTRISIARVRRIGLAQHFANRREARRTTAKQPAAANPTTDEPPTSIAQLIANAARERSSGTPSALGMQVNGAITPVPGTAAPAALTPAEPPVAAAAPDTSTAPAPGSSLAPGATSELPGREPSTLQEQLSRILAEHRPSVMEKAQRTEVSRAPPRPEPALHADSEPTPPVAGTGTHLIQIGAYNSAGEAERQLSAARQRAATVLSRASERTETVTKGEHKFYRAHFAGFDSSGATQACQELRRQSIDCFVKRIR